MSGVFWSRMGKVISIILILFGGGIIRMTCSKEVASPVYHFSLGVIMVTVGFYLYRLSGRLKAVREARDMLTDPRPPVLYLRAFNDDDISGRPVLETIFNILNLFFVAVPIDLSTVEEQVARIFKFKGPFICIGKPSDKLPPLGALRRYLSDDIWENEVRMLCARACLVVFRANGLGAPEEQKGFKLELEITWKMVSHEKLVYLLPLKQEEVDMFLSYLGAITGLDIPLVKVDPDAEHFSGLLYVDRNGQFRFQELKRKFWRCEEALGIQLKRGFDAAGIDLGSGEFVKPAVRRQLKAFLIDFTLLFIIGLVTYFITFVSTGEWLDPALFLIGLPVLLSFFYYAIFDFMKHASSIGRRYCKIVVLDKEKLEFNLRQSIFRLSVRMFSIVLFPIDLFLIIMYRVHLHDILSATREYEQVF